jgi:hypothetical protein
MKIKDTDIIFISYDEPNAEENWAKLLDIVPWAKRVHGVKGSDNAHKEAAKLSETKFFVGVDGDKIIDPNFMTIDIQEIENINCYSYCGTNNVNGLIYGNGGLKIWNTEFVKRMKTHEASDTDRAQVDFCWEKGYQNFPESFSTTVINKTPYQAWRAGFREGVKMLTAYGILPTIENLRQEAHWQNLHRLRVWSSIGSHVENGNYSILGARMGTSMSYSEWNYINVRDFTELENIYKNKVDGMKEHDVVQAIANLGEEIRQKIGLNWAYFDEQQSLHMIELYQEAISLGQTYYNKEKIWTSSS